MNTTTQSAYCTSCNKVVHNVELEGPDIDGDVLYECPVCDNWNIFSKPGK